MIPISRRAAKIRLNTTSARLARVKKSPARYLAMTTVSPASSRTIIAFDRADLPERLPDDEAEITFTARSDFSRLGREPQAIDAPVQAESAEATRQDAPPAELKPVETDIAAQRARQRDSDDRER